MLVSMTRKLCPLLIILLTTVSCGKKITDSSGSKDSKTTTEQTPEPSLVLELATNSGNKSFYTMPMNAVFKSLPNRLRIDQGTLTGKSVTVTYNISPEDKDLFEFKCNYLPLNSKELAINTCENFYGEDLGDITELSAPMDAGKIIKMELIGSYASGIVVRGYYIVEWK